MTHYITDIMTCNKQIRVRRHICGQMLHKLIIIALMMVVGGENVWGQTDYSGTYYIASGGKSQGNGNSYTYNSGSPANNFYLCPTEEWCYYKPDNDFSGDGTAYPNPFLTTYKCRDGAYDFTKAVWIIRKHSSENYYYIIQAKTGKYLLSNGQIRTTDNPDRIRVHLEAVAISNLDDKALFSIVPVNGYYRISPKDLTDGDYLTIPNNHGDHSTHTWLTVNNGNYNYLDGRSGKTGGPHENGIGDYRNTAGTVGIYTESDANAPFYFEEVVQQPVISQAANGDITLTCATSNTTIYYTLDGSDPVVPADGAADPTGPTYEYTGTFSPAQGSTGVKAVAVLSNLHAAVSKMAELSLICSTPTISFNGVDQTVTISATPADATIYYTTDGSAPIEGTSSVYSTPFTLTTTIVKAIATHAGFMTSDIATLTITQVATPTIQDNGSNAISITTETEGATIYYTTDGSTPTTSSTEYTGPLTENVSGVTIKAIAVKENMIPSEVGSGAVTLQCSRPSISKVGDYATISCSFPSSGVSIYYTKNGGTPSSSSTLYSGSIPVTIGDVIKAIAIATGYNDSEVAEKTIHEELTPTGGIYYITNDYDFETFVDMANTADGAGHHYVLQADVNASTSIIQPFTGTFDGGLYTISGLDHALFNTIDGGIVKNVMLDNVSISGGSNVGAIANEATGSARIYNCGVLGGSVSGSNYVGGLVGLLDGRLLNGNILNGARVINCFSYANITGGSYVGGIVGYNNFATTSMNPKTMVMNCMFYGNITGGTNKAPIYNGEIISNTSGNLGVGSGVGNYNYFRAEATFTGGIDTYNCALMAETRFLQRFEFFRYLMNSHLELAGWWATGTFSKAEMAKWVLEPSQIGSEHPYPILKRAGKYPSVVNIDAENAPHTSERNKGAVLGTLTVNIQMGDGAQYQRPTGAAITTSQLTLNITDKDPEHFNFNYYKVQLPYYNDVGTKNYNGNRVVTGWKIVSIAGGTAGTYSTGADAVANAAGEITSAPYNFADRNCTDKDLYSVSGRVFNQGAYWDVPEGVTAITIEPYWAKCVYLADASADVVYNENMTTADVLTTVGGGTIFTNGLSKTIAGDSQRVYTSMGNAIASTGTALFSGGDASGHTVYDYAVVLVGNYHQINSIESRNSKPYTVTSIDLDGDNEPDYSFMLRFDSRIAFHPVRYDFLNLIGLGMAQKSTGSSGSYNFGIMQPNGWFEATNTALFRVTQFEYENQNRVAAPYILQGGVIEQWVSSQISQGINTSYIHVGGNVWFKEFHLGCHQDKTYSTKHPPVSVTGGDYNEFYLTGLYAAASNYNDNAECYINGGRFGKIAGAAMEGIGNDGNNGNIVWQIQNADIEEFYGGGINAVKPIQGNITTVITGCHVKRFCGGPKFGDMVSGKTVTTTATNCTFGTFFGAGYGGNSYYRAAPRNFTGADASWDRYNVDWNKWINGEIKPAAESGNYANNVAYKGYTQDYISAFGGVSTRFDYQFLPESGNEYNVARLIIDFVSFSLATTHDVTSKLTGCTITGNFFGGGSLGKVEGNVTSTLTNCNVRGNVFGGGYDATRPTVAVMNTGGFAVPPRYDTDLGVFIDGVFPESVTYTWEHSDDVNSTETAIDKTNHILYTTEDLTSLGEVTGNVTLNILGNTLVEGIALDYEGNPTGGDRGGVFGGGDASETLGNTHVIISATDTRVAEGLPDYNCYNVFGGGNKADVMGNTTITMTNGVVYNRMFGGGRFGSVGTFTTTKTVTTKVSGVDFDHSAHAECIGKPNGLQTGKENTGKCTIIVSGGRIGPFGMTMPIDFGYVFGGGMGDLKDPAIDNDIEFRTYVYDTDVTIRGTAFILGGVYGGSENGRVLHDTNVKIQGGQIGCGAGMTEPYEEADFVHPGHTTINSNNALTECAHWTYDPSSALPYDVHASQSVYDEDVYGPASTTGTNGHSYYGNVFGGGSGYFPYEIGEDGPTNGYEWLPSAGLVEGDTHLTISGGHILTNAYGGNEMTDVAGTCYITMTGGTLGVPRTLEQIAAHPVSCYLFGAGKGDQRIHFNKSTNVGDVNIDISGGIIYGSVFGGGEDGHVLGDVDLNISGDAFIGTHGTSYVDGNVFGAGRGFGGDALTAGVVSGNVDIDISGGTMLGSIYGGGRLGSVGTYLVAEGDPRYGEQIPDGYQQVIDGDDLEDASATHGHITINISGGTIGNNSEYTYTSGSLITHTYGGNVFAGCMGRRTKLDGTPLDPDWWPRLGRAKSTTLTVSDDAHIKSFVYGGGEYGSVLQDVLININGGTIGTPILNGEDIAYYYGGVYGGGADSHVNLSNWDATANSGAGGWAEGKTSASYTTTVNLHSGTINGDVYGGGLGHLGEGTDNIPAYVYGNVAVNLNQNNGENDTEDVDDCVVKGTIFGCNNLNGTPKGTVTVHIYKTQGYEGHWRTNVEDLDDADDNKHRYELKAVYGGGNLAAYEPVDLVGGKTHVIIDGCYLTSICQVYGGGNAASTPGTSVDIWSTYEIDEAFGGGNGKDEYVLDGKTYENPGANVGYRSYAYHVWDADANVYKVYEYTSADGPDKDASTKAMREANYSYGLGKANMFIHGGRVHKVYGGSNTKGNVRALALTMLEDEGGCEFHVDEAYGGGKSAFMDGSAELIMSCIPGLKNAYGGAEAADIYADVRLNITNGHYDRVFGGNNLSGIIHGTITVNIEETGCHLLTIGQLFGGGNQAAYTAPSGEHGPTLNVRSFSSIGEVYGGGFGEGATITGDTYINIDVCDGNVFTKEVEEAGVITVVPDTDKQASEEAAVVAKTGTRTISYIEYVAGNKVTKYETVYLPPFTHGQIGAINNVYGGGLGAKVVGSTYVNIGTHQGEEIEFVTLDRVPQLDEHGDPVLDSSNNPVLVYQTKTARGAIITGNVFGGGNAAEVTGDTHVVIGKPETTTP